MANKKKSAARAGWEGLVEKLSAKASGAKPSQATRGRPVLPVDGREPGRKRGVGSVLEALFEQGLIASGLTGYEREFRFHPTRRWRFDYCWPDLRIAVEIEGATWSGGRHTTGSGFRADCEKYNHAQKCGYVVFRFTGDMVKSGEAITWIRDMINGH